MPLPKFTQLSKLSKRKLKHLTSGSSHLTPFVAGNRIALSCPSNPVHVFSSHVHPSSAGFASIGRSSVPSKRVHQKANGRQTPSARFALCCSKHGGSCIFATAEEGAPSR